MAAITEQLNVTEPTATTNVRKTARAVEGDAQLTNPVLQQLSKLQDGLNKFIDADWTSKRSPDDWGLAITMEASELMDSYPWKWWKNVNATPDFKNVKIELVDILHFSLSGTMQMNHAQSGDNNGANTTTAEPLPAHLAAEIVTPLDVTANAIKTFRNIINLTSVHRFDIITAQVVAAAEDLDFNLAAYYVAKHTLNFIRQLGGYKSGSYVKVNAGVEDNELLHACIQGVTVSEAIGESTYRPVWSAIMERTYTAFGIPVEQRRSLESWIGAEEGAMNEATATVDGATR